MCCKTESPSSEPQVGNQEWVFLINSSDIGSSKMIRGKSIKLIDSGIFNKICYYDDVFVRFWYEQTEWCGTRPMVMPWCKRIGSWIG